MDSSSVEAVPLFQEAITRAEALFAGEAKGHVEKVLPPSIARFAPRILEALRIPRSIVAPLIAGDRTLGLFSVQSEDLTEEDVPGIMAFAHQLAAAWHKAQLMAELRKSLEKLQNTQAQLLQVQKTGIYWTTGWRCGA